MAQLYPKELNDNFTASTNSSEKMIYDKAKELSDSFYIFHDITWDAPQINDSITKVIVGQVRDSDLPAQVGFP